MASSLGGEEWGSMREAGGKTIAVHDHGHKRRKDQVIENDQIYMRRSKKR
jgi:hypothetical protein